MNFQELDENDIVISGVGCKLPGSDNLSEFAEKLYDGVNFVTENDKNRAPGFFEHLPDFGGKIQERNKFDNWFFGISNPLVVVTDHMTRHISERTFEAMVDAGLNPSDLRGTNSTVYIATSQSDFDLTLYEEGNTGYGIVGRNRCMTANRVSFWLGINGSSVAMDGNQANGILSLFQGYNAIRNDRCDTAIVASASLQSMPEVAAQFNDFKSFSPDGKCKCYDDSANGWCRSEAIVVYVLQRAKNARRCYAVIEDATIKYCGDKDDALSKPSQQHWETILKEFYSQSKININDIFYVEGNAPGIKEEDAAELNALNSIFCKNRSSPLLVGSIISNIGHTDAASASCGILKAILSFEKGVIPKNLHYQTPNAKSIGLKNGSIKIVDSVTPIPLNGLIAINSQSIGGIYGHLVLRANPKPKQKLNDAIPRLILLSARTDGVIDNLLDKIEEVPVDLEQINLINNVFSKKVDKFLSRGYTILPKKEKSVREHQVFDPLKKPVWFIFSGMGSQWCTMGKRLMDFPLFRESIEKSHKVLEKKGLDLINIITTDDPKIFDTIVHSFVGITAIQIALIDILKAINIVPDFIIGHSVGEQACAYADGCLTAEQTILCSYSRGRASIETPLIKGFMAAIGKGYNQIKNDLPENVEVACHNAPDSCTISGPADVVQDYVKKLQEQNIFARTVNVANIAYHSKYITPAGPKLLKYIGEVIPEPKLRSEKWISTSHLEENWDTDAAKYCSAEYLTNNFLSSVYFEEGSRKIPDNAICIEIAPHGLLQAILKRSLGKNCINIPLTNRTAEDSLLYFLRAIGKMFIAGLEPRINDLYPKIEYPVSRGTGSMNHLVKWEHAQDIPILFDYSSGKKVRYSFKEYFLRTSKDGIGYVIGGKNYYPVSVFINLIWAAFASSVKLMKEDCPVLFEDVRVEKLISEMDSETGNAYITIGKCTGRFEVITDAIIIKGTIQLYDDKYDENFDKSDDLNLSYTIEIYDELERRGYVIGKDLKCLKSVAANENVRRGKVSTSADWLQSLESLIQLEIFEQGQTHQLLLLPLSIEKLVINPVLHQKYKNLAKEAKTISAELNTLLKTVRCGGIEMKGLKFQEIKEETPALNFESLRFVGFEKPNFKDLWELVDCYFGIAIDGCKTSQITIVQTANGVRIPPIASYLKNKFPNVKIADGKINKDNNLNFVITDEEGLIEALPLIDKSCFVMVNFSETLDQTLPDDTEIITKFSTDSRKFALLKKKEVLNGEAEYIPLPDEEVVLYSLMKELEKSKKITYLIRYKEPEEGISNFQKKLELEAGLSFRWLWILDEEAPKFDRNNQFYTKQLQKGLTTNVYKNGMWGSLHIKCFTSQLMDIKSALVKKEDDLTLCYVGVSFDHNNLPFNNTVEYSGTRKDGTNVIGMATICENKKLFLDKSLQWQLPDYLTLKEGATIPTSYALAYYCIKFIGDWQKGESILITDGLSCNGLAAISIALSLGASVYITVGGDQEITILKQYFPTLNRDVFVNHEADDFDIRLQLAVKNNRPEIIINNIEEEKFLPSVAQVANFGRIFHFGKKDLQKNFPLGMSLFIGHVSFYPVQPDVICRLSENEKGEIKKFITDGILKGQIVPLPKKIFQSKGAENLKMNEIPNTKKKTLFTADNFELSSSRLKFDTECSYLIIGDGTDSWVDIAEWLVTKNVNNIVISTSNFKNSYRTEKLKKDHKISFENSRSITDLLNSAKKLGTVALTFLLQTDNTDSKLLVDLNQFYRAENGHLIVVSKKDDIASNICSQRMEKGFTSTNFIWRTQETLNYKNLNIIESLSGQDPVIHVSDNILNSSQNPNRLLLDVLPSSIEEICNLGTSLSDEITLTELPTLGLTSSNVKEVCPFFIIPGLQGNPKTILTSILQKFMYPAILIQPLQGSHERSIQQLATLIVPKIQSLNNSVDTYNIIGISWGSYLAIEIAKLLEKSGGNVGLILIDGPLKSLKEELVAKRNLEQKLLNIIMSISKKVVSEDDISRIQFDLKLKHSVSRLELSPDEKKDMEKAVFYIYHNLKAMLDYDFSSYRLQGPITVVKSREVPSDFSIKEICDNVFVRNLNTDQNGIFESKELADTINGSAITREMNNDLINKCTWQEFEEFLIHDKIDDTNDKITLQKILEKGGQVYLCK